MERAIMCSDEGRLMAQCITCGSELHPDRATSPRRPASQPVPLRPWSKAQEKLALLYNEQGLRPREIADKLGLTPYIVAQIILTSRNRGML
jgi:hypothetical protein